MNSQNDPIGLPEGFYRTSMNTVNRGGMPQTRPGYTWKLNMPAGLFQGGMLFRPKNGLEQLVFAVAGKVYASEFPFSGFHQLENLSFREDAPNLYFCAAEKSSAVQPDETVKLITPYTVLIIQDGYTAPGVWDGTTNKHSTDPKEVPLGTVMAWAGNRLWVARRREIFAGDIDDPLSFREGTYLSNAKSFLLEKDVVALAEVTKNGTSDGQLLAFTDSSTSIFKSGIRKRTDWESTESFQAILFPEIGCVAHRSVVNHFGLLWWYSQFGLVNLDTAASTYVSSEFKYKDAEMAISKGYLAPTYSGIASAAFENYILVSTPFANVYNTHTWVLDKSPLDSLNDEAPPAWNSYWTGTRPQAWGFGLVQGVNRIFQFSVDLDGVNRIWEAFSPERTDNGCPIVWTLETRGYTKGSLRKKEFRFAEVEISELESNVKLAVMWAGASRGAYKQCSLKSIVATEGVIDDDREVSDEDSQFFSFKKQSRKIITADVKNSPPQITSCSVESERSEREDSGFQILIVGTGQAAVRSLRMHFDWLPDEQSGKCENDETGEKIVRFDGSATDDEEELNNLPPVYTSNKTYPITTGSVTFVGSGYGESTISQDDADAIALSHARNEAEVWFTRNVTPHDGNPDDPEV